jgi:sulfatase-like protein
MSTLANLNSQTAKSNLLVMNPARFLREVRDRRNLFLTSFLLGLAPSLAGFAAKFWFLNSKHGFANVAGALSVHSLTLGQRLSFFRSDLLFAVLLLPICFLLARVLLPGRWFWWIAVPITLLGVLVELLSFAELAVLGTLTGYKLLGVGLAWGLAHPSAALRYLFAYSPSLSSVKPAAAAAVVLSAIALAWRFLRQHGVAFRNQVFTVAAGLWIVCAPVAIASWFPRMNPTRFHNSMLSLSWESLFPSDEGAGKYQGLSIEALRPIYLQLVNAPDLNTTRTYWGAAKDYDVIFFIMETGPAQILMRDPSLKDFPNLQRLSQRAWVGTEHYTTSPESIRAISSVLLSTYPPNHAQSFEKNPGKSSGLIESLRAIHYQTGIYLPNVHGSMFAKQEEDYYETMGPDRVFTSSVPEESLASQKASPGWHGTEDLDMDTLHQLEDDFRASAAAGRRFFGVYLPQLSHEPWVDVADGGNEHDMAMRRYNLLKVEDRHLGELLAVLEKLGRLDRTLIVVACDHGLRSSASDSSFREGQVDDLTFHVPFFLYAPGIVAKQTNLDWPTSHIDVAPTILDLLGVSEGREFEAGTPIWNPGLKDRCIYFFASQFFGADGYRCGDTFAMWNPMLNVTYTGRTLHFTASDAVPLDSQAYREIVARVQGMGALRNAWYDAASSGPVALAALHPDRAHR